MHGTTNKVPAEQLPVDQAAFLPLTAPRYDAVTWHEAKVHRDSHVHFKKRLFSVPWQLVGKSVWLRATSASVVFYATTPPPAIDFEQCGEALRHLVRGTLIAPPLRRAP